MPTYALCPDVIIHRREYRWLLSNPRSRTHVLFDQESLKSILELADGCAQETWLAILKSCNGNDATEEFYGEHGLHVDHTGIEARFDSTHSGESLFNLLCKRWIIIDTATNHYPDYFQPLSSALDRDHLGTFHQRVGQFLTVKKRLKNHRWKWWHDQKFAADGRSIKDGPYKNIQENFIKDYFSRHNIRGLKMLDFGCGNGFYANYFADQGALVTGIDMSTELIEIANSNYGNKATFIGVGSLEEELDWLGQFRNEFDLLFLQDILLLLINPEDGQRTNFAKELLNRLFIAVKPNGRLYLMEPNSAFWLAGRYGNPDHPFAIVTEYHHQLFNVMPCLPKVIELLSQSGFALTEYLHPGYSLEKPAQTNYANEFPIWDFMCFRPIDK